MGIVVGGGTYAVVGAGGPYPPRGTEVGIKGGGAREVGGAGGTAVYAP